ncbi:hypothetical protein APICC_01704 [Apis cerana cerana]|uniref:Uncharacterized protein n=1 Tax=Apis cerana cerana TaxID=94128 RepID=A0A2A3E1B9_APICC|nr:hypothetical protein APICC_01704 [Apis cerana cerana]
MRFNRVHSRGFCSFATYIPTHRNLTGKRLCGLARDTSNRSEYLFPLCMCIRSLPLLFDEETSVTAIHGSQAAGEQLEKPAKMNEIHLFHDVSERPAKLMSFMVRFFCLVKRNEEER